MFDRLRPFLALNGTDLKSFWMFQAIFWSFIFCWRILYNFAHGFDVNWQQVPPRLISLTLSAIMVLILGHLAVRIMPNRLRIGRLVLIIAFTLVWALFLSFMDRLIFAVFEGEVSLRRILLFGLPMNYFFSAWMFVSWVVLFLLIAQFSRLREREMAIFALTSSAKEARMQMLVHQLNPHFLFNTLNSISALINETRQSDAVLMLSRLSRFLRHVVDPAPSDLIRLEDEISIMRDYIDIQKVRYGEQLEVAIECQDTSLLDVPVPKMILQPLVENSIKYGRLKPRHHIRVLVRAEKQQDTLVLSVEDNGPGFAAQPSPNGLGLRLVTERLEAHFENEARLRHQNLDAGGSRVWLEMPLSTRVETQEDEQ